MNVNLRLNREEVMMSVTPHQDAKVPQEKGTRIERQHYAPITRTKSERVSRDRARA